MPRRGSGNTVNVYGLSELEENFKQLGQKTSKQIMDRALKSGIIIIRDDARSKVPIGTVAHKFKEKGKMITVRPGNLQRKLKERRRWGNRATIGQIQYIIPYDGRAFYGKFIEWGWRTKSGKYIAPKARSLESAYNTKKEAAFAEVASVLGSDIEDEARRLGQS